MSERNKQLVRDAFDSVPASDWEKLGSLYDENVAYHASGGEEGHGRDECVAVAKRYKTAFPDLDFELLVQVAEGDFVATRVRATGTFTGPLGDMAPTGKKLDFAYMHLVRFQNGTIAEEWEIFDTAEFMTQLGVS